nr:unnamed protein product [Callosobruchus analis]
MRPYVNHVTTSFKTSYIRTKSSVINGSSFVNTVRRNATEI